MLPEIGHFSLILAFTLALAQGIVPLFGFQRKKITYMNVGKTAALGQCFFILLALGILIVSFIKRDFTVLFVYNHLSPRISSEYLLGNAVNTLQGALLLWCFFLSVWTSTLALSRRELEHKTQIKILMFLGFLNCIFLLFILSSANPFMRFFPKDIVTFHNLHPVGNPLYLFSPIIYYASYTAFTICFALSMIALFEGRLSEAWVKTCRPFALASWAFLSIGLVLSSFHHYLMSSDATWWSWTPLEITPLLAWLCNTALIHSMIVTEKENVFKSWVVFLIISTFAIMLMSIFFTVPKNGHNIMLVEKNNLSHLFLLYFFIGLLCFAFLTYLLRAPKLYQSPKFTLFSRESFLLLNSILFLLSVISLLLGTLYPILLESFPMINVSPTTFNYDMVFASIMVPLLLIMGFAPHSRWYEQSLKQIYQRLELSLITSLLLAVIIPFVINQHFRLNVFLGCFVSLWILSTTLTYIKRLWNQAIPLQMRQWSMILAHLGIAILVAAITLNMEYSKHTIIPMAVGQKVLFEDYEFTLKNITAVKDSNYNGENAIVVITKDQKPFATLKPEVGTYKDDTNVMKKIGKTFNFHHDFYINLTGLRDNNKRAIEIYYKPFTSWIWLGGLLVCVGILFAFLQRNKPRLSPA